MRIASDVIRIYPDEQGETIWEYENGVKKSIMEKGNIRIDTTYVLPDGRVVKEDISNTERAQPWKRDQWKESKIFYSHSHPEDNIMFSSDVTLVLDEDLCIHAEHVNGLVILDSVSSDDTHLIQNVVRFTSTPYPEDPGEGKIVFDTFTEGEVMYVTLYTRDNIVHDGRAFGPQFLAHKRANPIPFTKTRKLPWIPYDQRPDLDTVRPVNYYKPEDPEEEYQYDSATGYNYPTLAPPSQNTSIDEPMDEDLPHSDTMTDLTDFTKEEL